jgi:hypothetical protein
MFDATVIGTFLSAAGAIGTFIAIVVATRAEKRARKERRIEAVIAKYMDLLHCSDDETALRPATTFIKSGAAFLSRDELHECLSILEDAGEGNPLGIGLEDPQMLRRAREQNINLDDWAKRVSFVLGEAGVFDRNKP